MRGRFCIYCKNIAAKKMFFGGLISFLMKLVNVYQGLSAKNVKSQKVICNFYIVKFA